MAFVLSWAVLALAIWLAARLLPAVSLAKASDAIWVSALFGIVNFCIGWLIFFALGVGTLGIGFLLAFLTRLVTNAIVLKVVDALTHRLTIKGFGNALLAAAVIAAVSTLADYALPATQH